MGDLTVWTQPDTRDAELDRIDNWRHRAEVEVFLQESQAYLARPTVSQIPMTSARERVDPMETTASSGPRLTRRRRIAWKRVSVIGCILAPFVGYGLMWWFLQSITRG